MGPFAFWHKAKLKSIICALWPFYKVDLRIVSRDGLVKRNVLLEGMENGLGQGFDAKYHRLPKDYWPDDLTVGSELPIVVRLDLLFGKKTKQVIVTKDKFPEIGHKVVHLQATFGENNVEAFLNKIVAANATWQESHPDIVLMSALPKPSRITTVEVENVTSGISFPFWVTKYLHKGRELVFCFSGRSKSRFKILDITKTICTNTHVRSQLEK